MKGNPLGIIFSDMHGENLQELTAGRTTASIPFGGRYRLIDFTLSNMVNSGITKIGVIAKSNYQSLLDHINSGKEWDLSHKREGLYILPPFGRAHAGVYQGRLEALRGILEFIRRSSNEYVILSDCDIIANGDLRKPLEYHIQKSADITMIYRRMSIETDDTKTISSLTVDPDGRITDVRINPEDSGILNVGLNIWIVGKNFLERVITETSSRGLVSWERDIIQQGVQQGFRIYGWEFKDYAGQIGSMSDYYRISMDLLNLDVRDELFYRCGHIFTKVRDEVPAKYGEEAQVRDSCVADGCIIDGTVDHSVVFRDVQIGKGSQINHHAGYTYRKKCKTRLRYRRQGRLYQR
jgi:glucose-1-phosphate adenylyltransferase